MSKIWLVASQEYQRQVSTKKFFLILFIFPGFFLLIFAIVYLMSRAENRNIPIGYVDQSGFLKNPLPLLKQENAFDSSALLPVIAFPEEQEAHKALEDGKIQCYYILPPDYPENKKVGLVYFKPPGQNATRQFWNFLQMNFLRSLPPDKARRAVADFNLVIRWPEGGVGGGREISEKDGLNMLLPFFVGILFILILFISSGAFIGALVEEKGNRTVEILMTSLTPGKLITGKIIGVIGVSLTQILFWIFCLLLQAFIVSRFLGMDLLQNLSLAPGIILSLFAIALPYYVLAASLMTLVGVSVAEPHEAQQSVFLFIFPLWITFGLAKPIIDNPNGPLSLGLSFFPLTSLSAFCIRIGFSRVPVWQVVLASLILCLSAMGAVALAGRAFRLGMLRYGKRLSLKDIFPRRSHE